MSIRSLENTPIRDARVEHSPANRSEAVVDFSPRRSGQTLEFESPEAIPTEPDGRIPEFVCRETLVFPTDERTSLVTPQGADAAPTVEAYRALRSRLLRLQSARSFRTVAVTSLSRADGKTTTSLNLAHCFAQLENVSVLLIDADLRSRGLTSLLAGLPSAGLHDVIADDLPYSAAVAKMEGTSLYAMGAGTQITSGTELFSSHRWGELMRWASAQFSITIVDTVSMGVPADLDLTLSQCDRMLLVVRSGNARREGLRMATQHLDPNKLAGIVLNGSYGFKPEY